MLLNIYDTLHFSCFLRPWIIPKHYITLRIVVEGLQPAFTAAVQSQIEILYAFHIVFWGFFVQWTLSRSILSVAFDSLFTTAGLILFFAACHSWYKSICWSVCHTSSNITQYVPSHGYRSSQPAGSLTQAYCRPKPCPKPYTAATTLRCRTLIVWHVNFNKSGIVPNRTVPFGTQPKWLFFFVTASSCSCTTFYVTLL